MRRRPSFSSTLRWRRAFSFITGCRSQAGSSSADASAIGWSSRAASRQSPRRSASQRTLRARLNRRAIGPPSDNTYDLGMSELDFLASHAGSFPSKLAIICGDQSVDFATLNRRADQVAVAFQRLGLQRGDRVALMAFNCVESFEIGNGLRKVGLIVVPVNYRLRGEE